MNRHTDRHTRKCSHQLLTRGFLIFPSDMSQSCQLMPWYSSLVQKLSLAFWICDVFNKLWGSLAEALPHLLKFGASTPLLDATSRTAFTFHELSGHSTKGRQIFNGWMSFVPPRNFRNLPYRVTHPKKIESHVPLYSSWILLLLLFYLNCPAKLSIPGWSQARCAAFANSSAPLAAFAKAWLRRRQAWTGCRKASWMKGNPDGDQ
jgi:hypothetical protein